MSFLLDKLYKRQSMASLHTSNSEVSSNDLPYEGEEYPDADRQSDGHALEGDDIDQIDVKCSSPGRVFLHPETQTGGNRYSYLDDERYSYRGNERERDQEQEQEHDSGDSLEMDDLDALESITSNNNARGIRGNASNSYYEAESISTRPYEDYNNPFGDPMASRINTFGTPSLSHHNTSNTPNNTTTNNGDNYNDNESTTSGVIEIHRNLDNLRSIKAAVNEQDKLWCNLDVLKDLDSMGTHRSGLTGQERRNELIRSIRSKQLQMLINNSNNNNVKMGDRISRGDTNTALADLTAAELISTTLADMKQLM